MATKEITKRNWRFKDLTGQRFGRLLVIEFSHTHNTKTMWRCRCDCATVIAVTGNNLVRGKQISCGCYRRDNTSLHATTHGMVGTPEYESWQHAKSRCFNEQNKDFNEYGGRGITMSDDWANSFEMFFADMGSRPTPSHSLDRIDNDGHYCKENCRWATILEQNSNRRPRRWKVRPLKP